MNWRTRAGLGLLAAIVLLSAGYGALSQLGGVPDCPFGSDPLMPYETVCGQTFGGLWRSVGLGLAAGAGACLVAVMLALAARQLGGLFDLGIEKGAELFFAIPDVLVLITVAFALRAKSGGESMSLGAMAVALIAIGWAAPTRMVQNRLRSLERLDFVLAAEAIGAPRWRILTRHMLPLAWDYLLAIFLLRVPAIILTESTVSYLGFGLPLSEPSLGKYIGGNWRLLATEDWTKVAPAWALLVVVVIAFHWVGNGLLKQASAVRR